MTSFNTIFKLFLISHLLAACGGGGSTTTPPDTSGPTTRPEPSENLTYSQRNEDVKARNAEISPLESNYSTISRIPTTGSAKYSGFLYGTLNNTQNKPIASYIGIAKLTVGFNHDSISVSGSATDFKNGSNQNIEGSLSFSKGSLNRKGVPTSDATVTITSNGSLKDPKLGNLSVGMQLEGDFFGSTQNAIGGHALGKARTEQTSYNFNGGFIMNK